MPRKAVIVVDMLNDFVTGCLKCERSSRIIAPLKKLIETARVKGIPVIYSNDAHYKGLDKELEHWGDHAIAGTEGAEVIEELKPEPGDYIVPKRRYSGFFQTGLQLLLTELGVDTLIITGLHCHMCVRHTTADAFQWGYKIMVPSDATDAFTEEDYQMGMKYLVDVYGADVKTVDEILESL